MSPRSSASLLPGYFRGVTSRSKSSSHGSTNAKGQWVRHGDSYLVFVDPQGKQFRSKVQVARALGLVSGDEKSGGASAGGGGEKRARGAHLRGGEISGDVGYDWEHAGDSMLSSKRQRPFKHMLG